MSRSLVARCFLSGRLFIICLKSIIYGLLLVELVPFFYKVDPELLDESEPPELDDRDLEESLESDPELELIDRELSDLRLI